MTFEQGPYVQVACFCEMVLNENNVFSLIRIIDTLTRTAAGPQPPEDMEPFTHALNLVVMLKSGAARGRYDLRIQPEYPSGETAPDVVHSVHFEGEEKGHAEVLRSTFTFPLEGLYWFHVYVGDEKLTAIPLRVRYNRVAVRASAT
ncbi:MAG: hypothetical protein V1772_02620 [Chloroflexota bacterium]